jgi:hypothetical protein
MDLFYPLKQLEQYIEKLKIGKFCHFGIHIVSVN